MRTRRRLFHKGKVVNSQCVDSRIYLWELTSHPLYVFEFSGTSEFETNPCLFTENNCCLFTGVDHCLLEKNNCLVTEKIMVWFLEQIIACLLESWRSFKQEGPQTERQLRNNTVVNTRLTLHSLLSFMFLRWLQSLVVSCLPEKLNERMCWSEVMVGTILPSSLTTAQTVFCLLDGSRSRR